MHAHNLPVQSTLVTSHAVLVQVSVTEVGFVPGGQFTVHAVAGLLFTGAVLHSGSKSTAPLFSMGSAAHSSTTAACAC